MLESIRINGFRALKDVQLDLPHGKPIVLIGENGSGKSTLLDAVALVCATASGRAGRAILDRGGWDAVRWAGTAKEIELTVRFSKNSAVFVKEKAPVEYMIRFGGVRSNPTVLDEEVRVYKPGYDKPFVALKGGAAPWATNIQTASNEKLSIGASEAIVTGAALAIISDEARYPTPVHVKQALQSTVFYPSFTLGARHDDSEGSHESFSARQLVRTPRIGRTGRDLLTALYTLSTEFPHAWNELLSDLRGVFPWCNEIRFPAGSVRGEITLTWRDQRSGATLYLDDMSEGMRVYLALLAALHAQDEPALIAFDEPERSLHPRAMQRLVKVIESRAEKTPIVIATHADRMLDHLEDPAASLRITRFSSENGVAVEAIDPELLDAWRKDYSLSELRARGMLEAAAEETDVSS
jgi:predicted ATPase